MAPAMDVDQHTEGQIKSENAKSVKVLEGLLSKLTVSKSQDEINAASLNIALFINGDIEEEDAPTKYAQAAKRIRLIRLLTHLQGRRPPYETACQQEGCQCP